MKYVNRALFMGMAIGMLSFIGPVATYAGGKPLYNPEPIQIPCALSNEKLRSSIRNGALSRGWIPKDVGAGAIEARLDKRNHVAVVTISHDSKTVKIRYKSSENLNYEGSGANATIHGNYNNWIKNIEKDIAISLSKACG